MTESIIVNVKDLDKVLEFAEDNLVWPEEFWKPYRRLRKQVDQIRNANENL